MESKVFIYGVPFPESRFVKRTLETFYGIGSVLSTRILAHNHIHPTARLGSLAPKQILELTAELSHLTIENDLRRQVTDNIRRLKDMGSYRGRRHAQGLPVRGQKTRTQVRGFPFFLVVFMRVDGLDGVLTGGLLDCYSYEA
ncbi:hypothetical protein MMC12_006651 [Toensbergia leucococca]|nr:hypothetical protein [Toensbergia leucococca]